MLEHFCCRSSRGDSVAFNIDNMSDGDAVKYVGRDRLDSLSGDSPQISQQLHRDASTTLSQYTKVAKVGSGASGEVWLCLTPEKQEVAMKIISLKRTHGSDLLSSQTLREIAILRKLDHPNILRLQDYVVDSDAQKVYIVTEFCDMGPLIKDSDIGAYKPLPPCSPLFLAPEYLVPKPDDKDDFSDDGTTADIYALGVCLYVLCFGRSPWGDIVSRTALHEAVSEYINGDRVLEIPSGGDDSLDQLIHSLMHPDPSKRATMQDILTNPWVLADSGVVPNTDIQDTKSASLSLSREDIDNAVTVVSNIDFGNKTQRNLLVFHSAVNLLNLCSRLLDLAGAHASPNRTRLTHQLQSWTSTCCERNPESTDPNAVCFTSLQYGLAFVDWSKALEEDVVSSISEFKSRCTGEFKLKQLEYVHQKVLPILKQRIQELVLRLKSSDGNPNNNVDCVGPWRYFKAKNICNNFKAVFDAISNNPDSSAKIHFICNGQCVLKPASSSLPVHTIYLDVGMSELNFSDNFSASSGDEMVVPRTRSTDKGLVNPVYLPTVTVDILRDLICNSRKYSPPGTVIRAATWNQMRNGRNYLHMGVNDAGAGMNDPNSLVQFGAKGEQDRRGFGRGFGLTKCFVTVTSFLNGSFSVSTLAGRGTCIDIAVPVPQEAKINIDVRPPLIFANSLINVDLGPQYAEVDTDASIDSDYSDYSDVSILG
ncbi:hypothetical protein GEMRC1_011775 [Eukaryota sp. GEM-RC1]